MTINAVNAMLIGAEMARAGSASPNKLEMYNTSPINIPRRPMLSSTWMTFFEKAYAFASGEINIL
jgi:hypothetical protein